jgi:type III secretion protein D
MTMTSEQDLEASRDVATAALLNRHAAAPHWQLAVLGGLHAGALVDVSAEDWTLVGSAEDCDIVLHDRSVLPHHAALFPRGEQLQLRAIDGEVQALGGAQAPGCSVTLADASTWHVHGVTLGVGRVGSSAWDALRARLLVPQTAGAPVDDEQALRVADAGPAIDAATDDATLRNDSPPSAPRAAWRRHISRNAPHLLAAVAACAVVVAVGVAAWGFVWPKVQARENTAALASALSGLGLPELRVVEASNGHLRIEGAVRSESDRAKLLQALRQRGIYPAVDVVSGEQLAGTVQNSFRQRGLVVKAQYVGGGRVEVQGAAPSPATESVVQEVLAATNAVTQVALLDATAAPAVTERQETVLPSATPEPVANNSGRDPKRVVGVVGGNSPYVLTQDGRRYFVGSMLPDGTQVDQIDGHTVVFSRQGKPMTVQF